MNYSPYGYEIENGKVIIVEREAERIKKMFTKYLAGLSLAEVAKETGVLKTHASIGNMLRNRRYLGDTFYPPIIDEDTFQKVENERIRRAKMMGRMREPVDKRRMASNVSFNMPVPRQMHVDPIIQAEYVYSLIECEVTQDAE